MRTKDKAQGDHWPTSVAGQGVVKLVRQLVQGRQPGPGDGGKVVVLIVVADL